MAYDEGLAQRVREALQDQPELVEKKMFGGIGFMLLSNMCCGVNKDGLMVRVGLDHYESALAKPHTRKMDVGGRPMTGWVQVTSEGLESDETLTDWVQQGKQIALTLPPK